MKIEQVQSLYNHEHSSTNGSICTNLGIAIIYCTALTHYVPDTTDNTVPHIMTSTLTNKGLMQNHVPLSPYYTTSY